jgi:ATP-dependent DNA helicase RecG
MDVRTIEQRLRLGEDSRTEFKSVVRGGFRMSPQELKTLATEIVAFANARGGQVFIGIEDDGTVTGVGDVKQADHLMLQVVQACQTHVQPAIWCPVTKVEIGGQRLLVVDVPASSPDRPYRAGHVFYIRDASQSREATRDELVRLLQSQNVYFDETPVDGSTLDDLDPDAIDVFLRAHYEPGATARRSHYLHALKCLDAGDVPTGAGILLFGREPQRWFPDARISAASFDGEQMSGTFSDRREIEGRLLDQLDAAMTFLARRVPAPAKVEGWDRVDLGIPEPVLREAVLNAVTHRDYRAASQVRVFVFRDRVEVFNPGLLLNHLTLDSIRLAGITQRRNPVIAALLARARKRESLGMGIPEMIEQMRKRGLPEPEFDLQGGHFRVVLRAAPLPQGEA